ncbi:hypothetical protein [Kutzneria sp. CA-103260]|uniref:hypothetical protein n=1 Tax=Kutzneria sp. CA-103260 TaxID=2802641 RepID=UPI001BACE6E5|nr:hypothetical protein [Kutzneria sp. CA-103260]QUQ69476.1 hypothetical protein JJ691_72340 [Kutzneria sp. CA-103260]
MATVVVDDGVVVVGDVVLLAVVVVFGGVVVVVVVASGLVRPVHCVDVPAARVDDAATTVAGTVTVVVVFGAAGLPVSGLRRASGCSAIVLPGGSVELSSVSSAAVSLALVRCGNPNDGPAAGSSWPMSRVVSAVRPAKAAMGAITTAAKHPRPLAGSSR